MRALLATALFIVGCAAARELRLDRDALVGTTWREVCLAPEIAEATIRLEPDGRLAWSYDTPDSLVVEDTHTWAVEDGALWVRWTNGRAVSRYRATPDPMRLDADSSSFCVDAMPWLERVR